MYTKKDIIDILIRRDGISYEEARQIVEECQDEIDEALECEADFDEIEDILAGDLGLEMDYIWAFLN